MSDQAAESSAPSESPADKAPSKVRRISNPRPKKVAKPKVTDELNLPLSSAPESVEKIEKAESIERIEQPQAVTTGRSDDRDSEDHGHGSEWPEPEAASFGQGGPNDGNKRNKRRRRKGKGQGNNAQQGALGGEDFSPPSAPDSPVTQQHVQQTQPPRPQQQQIPVHQGPRPPKAAPEEHAKRAWKIFLAEVSEEGVALISDQDAKELARRCFRLAEIFIEEQAKRRSN